jgi:hypothetical protein
VAVVVVAEEAEAEEEEAAEEAEAEEAEAEEAEAAAALGKETEVVEVAKQVPRRAERRFPCTEGRT